jgi:uncharacterized membrane protein
VHLLLDYNLIEILEETIRFCFGLICHQNESLLFKVDGKIFPLCPRCAGMHIGFAGLLFLITMLPQIHIIIKNKFSQVLIISAICIAGIHWLVGQSGFIETDSFSRFVTGIISGTAVSLFLYFYRTAYRVKQRNSPTKILKINLIIILVLLFAVISILIVTMNFVLLSSLLFLIALFNVFTIANTIKVFINLILLKDFSSTKPYEVAR